MIYEGQVPLAWLNIPTGIPNPTLDRFLKVGADWVLNFHVQHLIFR